MEPTFILSLNLFLKKCFKMKCFLFFVFSEEINASEAGNSPIIGNRPSAASSAAPSPIKSGQMSPTTSEAWPAQSDEDIDRLVAMHQNRSSLSSLGVSRIFLKVCDRLKRGFRRAL